jgi:hypothetical protein
MALLTPRPASPRRLSNNTNVNLSWTAGSGATSYNLYRAAESGGEGTNPVVTGITGTSYTDTNLNSGTTYYYQVVAVNGSGPTGYSPEAHATTTGVNPDPAQFNFETDPQGWAGGGGVISGVATSTAQHYAGNQSLAVNINSTAAGVLVRVCGQRVGCPRHDDYLPCLDSERLQNLQPPALHAGQ